MTDRPIIFSAPMIRALLDGRKTQTRRILKPLKGVRYYAGDRLWVRENFAVHTNAESRVYQKGYGHPWGSPIYKATFGGGLAPVCEGFTPWKPSIHMPRWTSRLTLIVESVKVERLQDISEDDAESEGCSYIEDGPGAGFWIVPDADGPVCSEGVVECFERLWESINGPDSWAANPWVAAISFRVVKSNINAITEDAP